MLVFCDYLCVGSLPMSIFWYFVIFVVLTVLWLSLFWWSVVVFVLDVSGYLCVGRLVFII